MNKLFLTFQFYYLYMDSLNLFLNDRLGLKTTKKKKKNETVVIKNNSF